MGVVLSPWLVLRWLWCSVNIARNSVRIWWLERQLRKLEDVAAAERRQLEAHRAIRVAVRLDVSGEPREVEAHRDTDGAS